MPRVGRRLSSEPEPLLKLDVSDRPELARKYGVAIVPTVLRVATPDGAVAESGYGRVALA